MHAKTLVAVVGAVSGIAIGYVCVYATEVAVWSIIVGLVCGGTYVLERKRQFSSLAFSLFFSIFFIFLALGIVRVQLESVSPAFTCTSCTFIGTIVATPTTDDTYQTLVVQPQERETLRVQVRVPLYPKYKAGDTVQVSGKVEVPKPLYPHGDAQIFDYETYLLTHRIGSEMVYPKVEVIDGEPHELGYILMRFKESLVLRIGTNMSSPASLLASGMLFGDSAMTKDLKQTFRSAGLSHIVVLSGFNIAILISCALVILSVVPLVLRIIGATLFVSLFLMMVGVEASVLRASIMAFISLLATLVGRTYVARQALLISLFVLCLYEPYALLYDASLHLSFLATAGIVYVYEPLYIYMHQYIRKEFWCELIGTTLSAYISTLPYIMYAFGSVSVYALIANMLVLPLVPITMLLAFVTVVLSFFSPFLAEVGGIMASVFGNVIIGIARSVEWLPFSYLHVSITLTTVFFLYAGISLMYVYYVEFKENETTNTEGGYLTDVISY